MRNVSITKYCNDKLWVIKSSQMPFFKRTGIRCARILVLTTLRFIQNQCMVKAASLTFYTMLSIIPVLALAFGIAKGLGMEQYLKAKLHEATAQYPEVAEKLLTFASSTLQNTQGGIIAGVGVLLLIWSAVKLLGNIEANLNEIWGIRKGRTLVRKFTDYITILMICPILLLTSGSALVFATTHMTKLIARIPGGEMLAPVLRLSSAVLPLIIVWLVFLFIYVAIPNTKVNFVPAALGGLISACAYTILQSAYIFAQFTTSSLNAIYGSFAALPLFLIWLNLSWIVVLGGAQLVFAIQNVQEYEMLPMDGVINQQQKYIYSLEILALLADGFNNGDGVLSDQEISAKLQLPIRSIRELLFELTECGFLLEAVPPGKNKMVHYYQVAQPLEKITPSNVIQTLETNGGHDQYRPLDLCFQKILQDGRSGVNDLYNTPIHKLRKDFDAK